MTTYYIIFVPSMTLRWDNKPYIVIVDQAELNKYSEGRKSIINVLYKFDAPAGKDFMFTEKSDLMYEGLGIVREDYVLDSSYVHYV